MSGKEKEIKDDMSEEGGGLIEKRGGVDKLVDRAISGGGEGAGQGSMWERNSYTRRVS